jgi:hypothetical protein
MARYWKAIIALLGAVVELGALWVDAPAWFVSVVGFATAVLVFAKGNAPTEPEAVTAFKARNGA